MSVRRGRGRSVAVVLAMVAALAVMVLATGSASAVGPNAMRDGFESQELLPNDDGSTGPVPIGFPVNFFGDVYGDVYVNNNGNVTFDGSLSTFTPFDLTSTSQVIIAAFFADVDTSSAGEPVRYGTGFVGTRPAFGATWRDVDCFASSPSRTVRNHFQLVLIDRSDIGVGDFDIEFNYDQIAWETGEASGGSSDCQGGSPARVGYSNGDDTSFELPGSAVTGAFLDSNLVTGLIHNSRGTLQAGRYIFPVRNGDAPVGGTIAGTVSVNPPVAGALVQVCSLAGFCNLTTTNPLGQYNVGGLAPGDYTARAFAPDGLNYQPASGGPVTVVGTEVVQLDLLFTVPVGPPAGTAIESRGTGDNGIPIVYWGDDLDLATMGCPGGVASYEVVLGGVAVRGGPMAEGPAGTYSAVILAFQPLLGDANVVITIDCPGANPDEEVSFNIYIDPSGNVVDQFGNGIPGATVTLFRSDSSAGPFEQVPDGSAIMSPANRTNPDTTDAAGHFGWDVITGWYIVRAAAPDCHAPGNPGQGLVETEAMFIPPEVTDLLIELECAVTADTEEPVVTVPDDVVAEATSAAGAEVTFDAATATDNVGVVSGGPECDAVSGQTFPLGDTVVTCTASDAAGNVGSAPFTVSVVDTTAPAITVSVSPDTLWAPSHRMVDIAATIEVSDTVTVAEDIMVELVSVVSNEPDNGEDDGNTVDDVQGAEAGSDDREFHVRAERSGAGTGRVYTVTYRATDAAGNSAEGTAEVLVPLSKGKG